MTEAERSATHDAIEAQDALDKLHFELCGSWPRYGQTPAEIADAIRAAVARQRASDGAGQRELWEGGAE